MSTQKQASAVRYITVVSPGTLYTAFLHASTGDVKQQYDDFGNYYPPISTADPIVVQFVATSSLSTGVVVPDSIEFTIAGTKLTFDSSGACTTSGASGYFRKDGMNLVIIGNIAAYLQNQSAVLSAAAKKNGDTITASAQVTITPWQGLDSSAEVSIRDTSNMAFTFRTWADSITLEAMTLMKGNWTGAVLGLYYEWCISDPIQQWKPLVAVTGAPNKVTIRAKDVHSYATVMVKVYRKKGTEKVLLGVDTVGLMDASDPLDIVDTVVLSESGLSSDEVAVSSLRLNSNMPSGAYLKFTPKIAVRGTSTPLTDPVTWLNGILCDPTGLQTRSITPSNDSYTVLVSYMAAVPGTHSFIMTGRLT